MQNNKIIGFTSVVGDFFHAGHVAMIQECRLYCDYLIVGVMADTHDRTWKNVPIQSLFERFYQVLNCKGVNSVIALGSEKDLELALKSIPKIDIRFVGEDYINKDFTGKETCEKLGIRIMYTKRNHGLSSTELSNRIIEQWNKQK